jgi:hypothetical protein
MDKDTCYGGFCMVTCLCMLIFNLVLLVLVDCSSFLLYKSMFIAYFMALMLSCKTIGSIKVLDIVYKFLVLILYFCACCLWPL